MKYSLELSQGVISRSLGKRTAQQIARRMSEHTNRALFVVEATPHKGGGRIYKRYWLYKAGKLSRTFTS